MLGKYIGRLQIDNDNIDDFHKYIRCYELIGYTVKRVVTNEKAYDNYTHFEQDMKNPIKLRTIRITLQRGTETIEYYNNKFNTRTWYCKDNSNQEYDLSVRKQEELIFYKATKEIELFNYKEFDVVVGKDYLDLMWIIPLGACTSLLIDSDAERIMPFVVMFLLFITSKARLSLYNVIKLK